MTPDEANTIRNRISVYESAEPIGSAIQWMPIDTAPQDTKSDYFFALIVYGPNGDQSTGHGMRYKGEWFAASVFYKGGPSDGRQLVMREHKVSPTHWAPALQLPNQGIASLAYEMGELTSPEGTVSHE